MQKSQPTIGINVSKLKLDVALLVRGEIQNKVVENDLAGFRWLRVWLTRRAVDVAGLNVCMQASGPYSEAAALALTAMGMIVSDVDPARVMEFACDASEANWRSDAVLLARFGAAMRPAPWVPPPTAQRTLQSWLTQLHALRQLRRDEHLRLLGHRQAGQTALADHVEAGIACVDEQLRLLARAIDTYLHRHPALAQGAELVRHAPASVPFH
ncbi:MAG TPA: hypothetical protein DCW29_21655 [Janthinobacterium sp.]|nr:hypothetical protein [Janthinobacterium sp.]